MNKKRMMVWANRLAWLTMLLAVFGLYHLVRAIINYIG